MNNKIKSTSTTSIRMSDGNIVHIESHDFLPSTADLAREYAKAGYGDRYVVFAERQTTSKLTGTKLSTGESEYGIFLSCILRPSIFSSQVGLLTPLTAVALMTAMDEYTPKTIENGWLSDIYCDGKKIGGISVEGKLDSYSSYEYIILTFAVKLHYNNFPPRLSDMISKVFENENASISFIMAKTILKKFFEIYSSFKTPEKYIELYRKRCILTGKTIKYIDNNKKYKCKVVEIDDNCQLIIEDKNKEIKTISNPKYVYIPTKFKLQKKK